MLRRLYSMKEYTLYLDESETHDYVNNRPAHRHFCMAGAIIANDDYAQVEQAVTSLKQAIWPTNVHANEIVLHQMRIIEAEHGRLNNVQYPDYGIFRQRQVRRLFYRHLQQIFFQGNITIVGSSINIENLERFYKVPEMRKQDEYLIAMQLLLENYCHFLCTHDGRGKIIYEQREQISDERLRDKYYHMKLMGSMYMPKNIAEKHLLGIDFVNKNENNIGLQLADFIPNSFARNHAGFQQAQDNIFNTLRHCLYDGTIREPVRFGVKYMP